jgi:hypothetical protein
MPGVYSTQAFSRLSSHIRDITKLLVTKILTSGFREHGELEPELGPLEADQLLSFWPVQDRTGYGKECERVLAMMVDLSNDGGYACLLCGRKLEGAKWQGLLATLQNAILIIDRFM